MTERWDKPLDVRPKQVTLMTRESPSAGDHPAASVVAGRLWAPLTLGAVSTADIDATSNFLTDAGQSRWWWLLLVAGIVGLIGSGVWGFHIFPNAAESYAPPRLAHNGHPAPAINPRNGLGVASLVVAIVALALVWSVVGGVVLGLIAAGIGAAAHRRARRGIADNGGVAVTGMVLGFVAILIGPIFIPVWLGLWNVIGGDDFVDCMKSAAGNHALQHECVDQLLDD